MGIGRAAGHLELRQTDAGVVARGQGAMGAQQVRGENVCAGHQRDAAHAAIGGGSGQVSGTR